MTLSNGEQYLLELINRTRLDPLGEAARYGIDRLKEIVPVWKKEVGPNGEEWIEGDYIGADPTGTIAWGNTQDGVLITNGSSGNGGGTHLPDINIIAPVFSGSVPLYERSVSRTNAMPSPGLQKPNASNWITRAIRKSS